MSFCIYGQTPSGDWKEKEPSAGIEQTLEPPRYLSPPVSLDMSSTLVPALDDFKAFQELLTCIAEIFFSEEDDEDEEKAGKLSNYYSFICFQ